MSEPEKTCPSADYYVVAGQLTTAACAQPAGHYGWCLSRHGRTWIRFEEGLRQRNLVYVPTSEGGPGVRELSSCA